MASLTDVEVKEIQKAAFELVDKGDYENATGLIQTLLEHGPNDSVALNFRGVIHLGLSNHHLAYQYFRRALQEKPDSAPVWVNYGLASHELHRNQEAINASLHSAKCDNEYTKAYVNAAAIFIEESRWDEAEKGRGRFDRICQSPDGGVYLSMILRPKKSSESISLLPLVTALSVARTINSYGLHTTIKWPNDVQVNGKKIAGILLESEIKEHEVI